MKNILIFKINCFKKIKFNVAWRRTNKRNQKQTKWY